MKLGRKKERVAIIVAFFSLIVFSAIGYLTATAQEENPPRIALPNKAGMVLFTHEKHFDYSEHGIACVDCHHTSLVNEFPPKKCSSCHGVEGESELGRKDAYHEQCIGCHEEIKQGPTECTGCHWK